ncbi:MAG: Lrp/AsnC family transcriptional regulator [Gammaproteobacteria bacterium]
MLSALHKHLLNDYQHDFPLTARPYLSIAEALNVTEEEVMTALNALSDENFISRIGPIIPPNQIGKSTLVAMAVPQERLKNVAEIINSFPEVNHNYEREHRFNLWFVLIASSDFHLQAVIQDIELRTGYKTMQLPLLDEFFIDLGFALKLDHD